MSRIRLVAVFALKLDVVDGKHRLDALIFLCETIEHVEKHGTKRGVPVVCVKHVGIEINERKHFEHRFREKRKTLAVVKMSVQALALEIVFVVHKIVGHAVVNRFVNTAILSAPAQIHKGGRDKTESIAELVVNLLFVERDDDTAIVSQSIECFWQRTCHVAESARADKRHSFRCNK